MSTSAFPTKIAKRATLLLSLRDHVHHGSLMVKIVQRARRAKLAGATVFEATEGYGHDGRIHQSHAVSDDSPVSIVLIDSPELIDAFLEEITDLLRGVTVVLDDVEIVEL